MQRLRYGFIGLGMLLGLATTATAEVSIGIGIGLPNVSIGINLPLYPELVPVRGYPVYYAPRVNANYFFYDGMYWVYQDDNWYASSWYNGPWSYVDPYVVPVYILRVPVSYYRQPPPYFRGWRSNAPPRWNEHWGRSWEQRRGGWDRWNRSAVPRRAPLPVYQRQYAGDRYPRGEQQHRLHNKSYRYQPRDKVVRQHLQQVNKRSSEPPRGRQERPQVRSPKQRENHQRPAPVQAAPRQRGPSHEQRQQPPAQREQRAPQGYEQQRVPEQQRGREQKSQDKGHEQDRGRGQGNDRGQDKGHGQDKNEGRGR